jgi:hypothetical protein
MKPNGCLKRAVETGRLKFQLPVPADRPPAKTEAADSNKPDCPF